MEFDCVHKSPALGFLGFLLSRNGCVYSSSCTLSDGKHQNNPAYLPLPVLPQVFQVVEENSSDTPVLLPAGRHQRVTPVGCE